MINLIKYAISMGNRRFSTAWWLSRSKFVFRKLCFFSTKCDKLLGLGLEFGNCSMFDAESRGSTTGELYKWTDVFFFETTANDLVIYMTLHDPEKWRGFDYHHLFVAVMSHKTRWDWSISSDISTWHTHTHILRVVYICLPQKPASTAAFSNETSHSFGPPDHSNGQLSLFPWEKRWQTQPRPLLRTSRSF